MNEKYNDVWYTDGRLRYSGVQNSGTEIQDSSDYEMSAGGNSEVCSIDELQNHHLIPSAKTLSCRVESIHYYSKRANGGL